MKVSDLQKNEPPPNILLYGEVGCGKTILALTLGEDAQIIDVDLGLRSGYSLKDEFTTARMSVDVKQFAETSLPRKALAFEKTKSCIYDIATQCNQNRYPFNAVILDSLTVFAEQALNYILGNKGKIDHSKVEIQHWGMAFSEIKMVLAVLTSLPIPVIVIGHEQIKTYGKGKDAINKLELAIKGKNMPAEITRLFDEVWYMRTRMVAGGQRQYVIQTLHDGTILARSRACLPNMTDTKIGMWKLLAMMGYANQEKTAVTP